MCQCANLGVVPRFWIRMWIRLAGNIALCTLPVVNLRSSLPSQTIKFNRGLVLLTIKHGCVYTCTAGLFLRHPMTSSRRTLHGHLPTADRLRDLPTAPRRRIPGPSRWLPAPAEPPEAESVQCELSDKNPDQQLELPRNIVIMIIIIINSYHQHYDNNPEWSLMIVKVTTRNGNAHSQQWI